MPAVLVECEGSRASVPAFVLSGHILGSCGQLCCPSNTASGGDGVVVVVVVVVVDDGVRTKSSQTTSYQCDRLACGTADSVNRGGASVVPKMFPIVPVECHFCCYCCCCFKSPADDWTRPADGGEIRAVAVVVVPASSGPPVARRFGQSQTTPGKSVTSAKPGLRFSPLFLPFFVSVHYLFLRVLSVSSLIRWFM